MFTLEFWKAALERAIKTFAQTLVVLLGANAVDVLHLDWIPLLSLSVGAALVSVLTSIASGKFSGQPGPSLTNAEVLPTPAVPDSGEIA